MIPCGRFGALAFALLSVHVKPLATWPLRGEASEAMTGGEWLDPQNNRGIDLGWHGGARRGSIRGSWDNSDKGGFLEDGGDGELSLDDIIRDSDLVRLATLARDPARAPGVLGERRQVQRLSYDDAMHMAGGVDEVWGDAATAAFLEVKEDPMEEVETYPSVEEYEKSSPLNQAANKENGPHKAKDPKPQGPPPANQKKKPGIKRREKNMADNKRRKEKEAAQLDSMNERDRKEKMNRDGNNHNRFRGFPGAWHKYGPYGANAADERNDLYNTIIRDKRYGESETKIVNYKIVTAPGYTTYSSIGANGFANFVKQPCVEGKTAVQSSTAHNGYVACRAVDGVADPDGNKGHCAETSRGNVPWWRYDMGDVYTVNHVTLLNRYDNKVTEMRNFVVRVGNDTSEGYGKENKSCNPNPLDQYPDGLGTGDRPRINCDDKIGRYVSIQMVKPGLITMCDVEIFGPPPPEVSKHPVDVHVFHGEDVVLECDGHFFERVQWMRGSTALDDSVRVAGAKTKQLVISKAAIGDSGEDYACEVFGKGGRRMSNPARVLIEPSEFEELAMFRTAWSSDDSETAPRAIDGYEDPNEGHGHCATAAAQGGDNNRAWWVVDLGEVASIGFVRIMPKLGGRQLSHFYVAVSTNKAFGDVAGFDLGDTPTSRGHGIRPVITRDGMGAINGTADGTGAHLCGNIHTVPVPAGKVRQVSCKQQLPGGAETDTFLPEARYIAVQVDRPGERLSLCHVEVYGKRIYKRPEPRSCLDLKHQGIMTSGKPVEITLRPDPALLLNYKGFADDPAAAKDLPRDHIGTICDQETYGGGWTLIVRQDASQQGGFFSGRTDEPWKKNVEEPLRPAYSIAYALYNFRPLSDTDPKSGLPIPPMVEYLLRWPDDVDLPDEHWAQSNVWEDEEVDAPVKDFEPMHTLEGFEGLVRKSNVLLAAPQMRTIVGSYTPGDGTVYYDGRHTPKVVELYAREYQGQMALVPELQPPDASFDEIATVPLLPEAAGANISFDSWGGFPSQIEADVDLESLDAVPDDFAEEQARYQRAHALMQGKRALFVRLMQQGAEIEAMHAAKETRERASVERDTAHAAFSKAETAYDLVQQTLENEKAALVNAKADAEEAARNATSARMAHDTAEAEGSDELTVLAIRLGQAEKVQDDYEKAVRSIENSILVLTARREQKANDFFEAKKAAEAADTAFANAIKAFETAEVAKDAALAELAEKRRRAVEGLKASYEHDRTLGNTYAEGLQQGVGDLWQTFETATKAGFKTGLHRSGSEVTAKFMSSYRKGYGRKWHQGREIAHSERKRDAENVAEDEPDIHDGAAAVAATLTQGQVGGPPDVDDDDFGDLDGAAEAERQKQFRKRCREMAENGESCRRFNDDDIAFQKIMPREAEELPDPSEALEGNTVVDGGAAAARSGADIQGSGGDDLVGLSPPPGEEILLQREEAVGLEPADRWSLVAELPTPQDRVGDAEFQSYSNRWGVTRRSLVAGVTAIDRNNGDSVYGRGTF